MQGGNEVMLRRIEELVEEIDRVQARVEEHRRLGRLMYEFNVQVDSYMYCISLSTEAEIRK